MAHTISAAVRSLRRAQGFSIAAVLTVAVAVSAITAVSAVMESVLLRPIPTRAIGELVALETNIPDLSLTHLALAPGEVFDLDRRRDLFQSVGGYRAAPMNLTGSGDAQRISAVATIGSFFAVFDAHPALGRLFDSTDARGNKHVVVLSHAFWRALTGSDRSIVGRSLTLDGESYLVVGVLSGGFEFPRGTQLWTPQPPIRGFDDPTNHCCKSASAIGRLQPDVARARVAAELTGIMENWRKTYPVVYAVQNGAGAHAQTLTFDPLAQSMAGQLQPILLVLMAAGGLLLLIACVNVASLELVRATSRARDTALRVALGASWRAIVLEASTEAAAIAVAGAALGIVVGIVVTALLPQIPGWEASVARPIAVDWRVAAFSAVVSLIAASIFGVAPVVVAAQVDPTRLLSSTTRSATLGRRGNRVLGGAVIVQIALALVLLLACGVSLRSLQRLLAVDPGFRPEGVMRMRLSLTSARYGSVPARLAFQQALLAKLSSMPGSVAAGTVSGGPFSYLKPTELSMGVKAVGTGAEVHSAVWVVGGDYFRAMSIPVRAGRTFDATDDARAPKAWLVDETLARRLFRGEDPVGKQIEWSPPAPNIVGVVGAIKKSDLAQADEPSLYWSFTQYPQSEFSVVLRTSLRRDDAFRLMRAAVRDLDPALPPFDLAPVEQGIDDSLAPRRIGLDVLAALAVISLALAALGIYGVMSYATTLRTREIGIRVALGADSRVVMRDVLRRGGLLAATGIVVGAAVFVSADGVLGAFLFGVSAHDAVALTVAIAVISVVACAACWFPARRAARVDPVIAFRAE